MGVGKALKRVDAYEKVTGRATYVEDLIPANCLYIKMLHSTIGNGIVKNFDLDEAKKMPGVVDIITCFDVPNILYPTAGHPLSIDPSHEDVADKLILESRVRFYGDDIAAVVADTPLNAQKAVEKIKVEYEVYEPHVNPVGAINDKYAIHEEKPDNQLARMDFKIDKDNNVTFYNGSFSAETEIAGRKDMKGDFYSTPAVHATHMENHGVIAYMEDSKIVVITPGQNVFTLRRNIARAIDEPIGNVRVIKPYVGGGFGNKQDTMYEPICAFATKRLGGRPVTIQLTREECFTNSRTRHAFDMHMFTEVDDKGIIQRKGLRINSNGGAYAAHNHAVAAYAVTNNFQTYVVQGECIGESCTAYTNRPSAGAMRGYGIPQLAWAMESQMDDIAYKHGWDPIDFRLKNVQPEGFVDPFDKFVAKANAIRACIEKGRELSDWDRKRKEYSEFNKTSKDIKKGIGMALFAYKTAVWPLQIENASCRIIMNEDGTAQMQVSATELGQGSDTVFVQMASEITTIPEEKIKLISTQDTDISPYDAGAYASRQSYVTGGAVKKAALKLKEEIIKYACIKNEIENKNITIKNEKIVNEMTGEVIDSIGSVCKYINFVNDQKTQTKHIVAEETYTHDYICFAYGTHFVDLEVDVPMGKLKINKIYAIHDSGKILNPETAKQQVQGGIAMALGYSLTEQMLYDEKTGRMLNNNLLDYKIPTAMDVPEMDIVFIEHYEPSGPFGNKALGEPPTIPTAPAIRNAILHATGVGFYHLPLNPQRLVEGFKNAGLYD